MTNKKEILDLLMKAMELEKEIFDLYTRAEQKTFDRSGKRIFHWLARTEEQHYLKLSELYRSLDDSGRWVFYGGSDFALEPEHAEGSFSADDRAALEMAMEVEKKGIAYFAELASRTDDPEGKGMLERMREEEEEHLRVIEAKYAEISEK